MTAISDKSLDQQALVDILNSLLTDITACKTAVDNMATKLNADAGVTDVDYSWVATLTTTAS